jgi:FixJ family two-component response regulator
VTPAEGADAVVCVVDDDASVRRALERVLRAGGHRTETFASASEFLEHAQRAGPRAPGCLVLDVQLPGLNGLELQSALAAAGLDLPIVFITGHGDIPMSVRAMKAGAVDFLPKPVAAEDLLGAVEQALARAVEQALARADRAERDETRRRLQTLTAREHDVLALVTAGRLNKQIAARLGISLKTVKVHRARALEKLGAASVAEAVRAVDRAGGAGGASSARPQGSRAPTDDPPR